MPAAPRSATETGSGTSRRWPKTLRYSMRRPFQPSAVRPTPAAAPMMPSSVPPCPLRRAPAAAARASACVTTSTAARLPKATSAGIARQPSHAMHSPGSLPSIQFAWRCLTARSVRTPSSSREGARHPVKGPSPATATRAVSAGSTTSTTQTAALLCDVNGTSGCTSNCCRTTAHRRQPSGSSSSNQRPTLPVPRSASMVSVSSKATYRRTCRGGASVKRSSRLVICPSGRNGKKRAGRV